MFSSSKILNNFTNGFFKVILRSYDAHHGKVKQIYKNAKSKKPNWVDPRQFKEDILGEVLYGIHPVRLALMANRRLFNRLCVNENVLNSEKKEIKDIFDMAQKLSIPISVQKNFVLDALTENRPHQGFCLDANKLQFNHPESEIISELNKVNRFVILDSIQDPQNFGSILRSCYYFGYTKVLTNSQNSCGITATVSKASSGALEVIDIYNVPDMADFLSKHFMDKWLIIGTSVSDNNSNLSLDDAHNITDKQIAVVFGNEEKGMSETMEAVCHKHVTISSTDQSNLVGCLNVSVATGIILHALKNSKSNPNCTDILK